MMQWNYTPPTMKKSFIALLSFVLLAGCSFLTPYQVTFTTPALSAVNPASDTLDLALSQPAMAYISAVDCEGHDPVNLLPVVNEAMTVSNVHNLSLELLNGYAATTLCEVTITIFDQTTTSTNTGEISLYVLEKPAEIPEYADQIVACEEPGGAWNDCGSSCEEGAELCIQVCVPQCELPEAVAPVEATPSAEPAPAEETQPVAPEASPQPETEATNVE